MNPDFHNLLITHLREHNRDLAGTLEAIALGVGKLDLREMSKAELKRELLGFQGMAKRSLQKGKDETYKT